MCGLQHFLFPLCTCNFLFSLKLLLSLLASQISIEETIALSFVEQSSVFVRLDPKDARAHENLGISLWLQGHSPGAESSFREAIRLDPKDQSAQNHLCELLMRVQRGNDDDVSIIPP